MKILIIAPSVYALPVAGYGGIESLIYNYVKKLAEQPNVEVTLAAPKWSHIPGVKEVIETVDVQGNQALMWREDLAAKHYLRRLKEYDCIHDFSHAKIVGRLRENLPAIHMLWHAYGGYPEPKYNLMALSKWHAEAMKQQYKQEVKYIHMGVDTDFYTPQPTLISQPHLIYIGHPAPTKGMIEAITYARKTNHRLTIIGGQVPAEGAQYRERAQNLCDGKQVIWLGEISNQLKRGELATATALLFPVMQDEGSSLTIMESLACGIPVVTSNRAAYPELVSNEVGVLCNGEPDFLKVLANRAGLASFNRTRIREYAVQHFSLTRMVNDYMTLYKEVAEGLRW